MNTSIRCEIADLIVDVPKAGGISSRCTDYLYNGDKTPDIVICEEDYFLESWRTTNEALAYYLESGLQFYLHLIGFNGMMLHASAVEYQGKAYLFSGPCGTGKSTHTRLWQQVFGPDAHVFNDDKPALRRLEDRWYAYGTPWCGKDGININRKVPLAGICFLKQSDTNRIRRLEAIDAVPLVFGQTIYKFNRKENLEKVMTTVDSLVRQIPIYELENRPEPEAAMLSYETMRLGAEDLA